MLKDADMLQMEEKGISSGLCHVIHQYAQAKNKYLKDYDTKQRIVISHVLGCKQFVWMGNVTKGACGWFRIEKNKFRFDEEFIQNYDKGSHKSYKLEVDVKHTKELHKLHSDLLFLLKKMKIKLFEKLVCNLYEKENTQKP